MTDSDSGASLKDSSDDEDNLIVNAAADAMSAIKHKGTPCLLSPLHTALYRCIMAGDTAYIEAAVWTDGPILFQSKIIVIKKLHMRQG